MYSLKSNREPRQGIGKAINQFWSIILATVLFAFVLSQSLGFSPRDLAAWINEVLGPTFVVMMLSLSCFVIYLISRLLIYRHLPIHLLVLGRESAQTISILALTYTLLGIAEGIGLLATEPLDNDNLNAVIQSLAGALGTAFYSSVIGIPASAILGGLLNWSWHFVADLNVMEQG